MRKCRLNLKFTPFVENSGSQEPLGESRHTFLSDSALLNEEHCSSGKCANVSLSVENIKIYSITSVIEEAIEKTAISKMSSSHQMLWASNPSVN